MRYAIVVVTIIAALFCRAVFVSVYKMPSQKMAPVILAGDFIFSSKAAYGLKFPWAEDVYFRTMPEHGNLVVFTKNSKIFIKRVLAVPQDEVEIISGEIWLNSVKCDYTDFEKTEDLLFRVFEEKCGDSMRKIIKLTDSSKFVQTSKLKLNNAQFFVANDNRNIEDDLSSAEMISSDQIIGKPLFVWISYSSTQDFISKTLGIRWNRILTKLN